jgi:hypothetical protein
VSSYFISYARSDLELVQSLVQALRVLGHEPFYDSDLVAGRKWWSALLDRIQTSDGFLPVLSAEYLQSEACYREARWAIALGIPLMPIDIQGTKPGLCEPEIAEANWVRYDLKDPYSIGRLARGLTQLPPVVLPSPLPERPAIPVTYFAELDREIRTSAAISSERQDDIIEMLKGMLGSREHDTAADLLIALRTRPELTAPNSELIDSLVPAGDRARNQARLLAGSPGSGDRPTPTESPIRRHRRALIAALVVVACGVAGAVAYVAHRTPTGHSPTSSTASNLDCSGPDDFLGVTPSGRAKDTLLFYPRTDLPDKEVPTKWLHADPSSVPVDPSFGATTYVSLILPGDMDGDGRPDLVGEKADGSLWLMPGTCTGVFTAKSAQPMLPPTFGIPQLTPIGDFNGDGHADLLGVDSDGGLFLYAGTGHGKVRNSAPVDDGWTAASGVGDVNHDGFPDVIDRRADGSLRLFESNGRGGWTAGSAHGLALSLRLPPSEFPYVIGGSSVYGGPYPDLVATDSAGNLVAFEATADPAPDIYRPTCGRVGGGWSAAQHLVDIADSVAVPHAPIPPLEKSKSEPDCRTKTY